ncbi:hypothetical protein [Robertmurraya sp.]|uniref:hypothetical protein n=1 Tax=Robertmurraya sp. TaxID=2837525 RepID=UPI003703AC73
MRTRAKQVFLIMAIGLIILIASTIINGEMNANNFIIFLSGGILGLVIGRNESKKEEDS